MMHIGSFEPDNLHNYTEFMLYFEVNYRSTPLVPAYEKV